MSGESISAWQKYKKSLGDTRPWHLITERTNLLADEESNSRLDICRECPEFISLTTQCKKCGCVMKGKTRLANATCPLGKW